MDSAWPGSTICNIEPLSKYECSSPDFGERDIMPDPRTDKRHDVEEPVEKIVGHKWDAHRKHRMYLVRWEGFSPLLDIWVSAAGLRNAPQILADYRHATLL